LVVAPSIATLKELFALSMNVCAFADPDSRVACEERLADPTWESVKAEVCHIRGQKVGSARHDPNYDDVDGFENLILFCPNDHTMVDKLQPAHYTVEMLEEMKRRHEERAGSDAPFASDTDLGKYARNLLASMEVVWLVKDLQASRRLAREANQVLAGAINRLGDREKIVMSLYYYEGLTLAEIGQVLGVQTAQARHIRRRALRRLERTLGRDDVTAMLEALGRERTAP
jgi:RNA polymerase sigma factor (sigma-70 family)